MGVPGLFKFFVRRFPDIIVKEQGHVDYFYIDFNAVIHRCCKPVFGPVPKSEDEILKNVKNYLLNIVKLANPQVLLYISEDGVAPKAKINQQRARRYHSALSKVNLIEEIKNDENFSIDEISEEYIFESNSITPGTPFMQRLSEYVHKLIEYQISTEWKFLTVIYSTSKVPGEGEQKIFDFIRNQDIRTKTHVIYSPDADLIFLSLLMHENKIYLMRNNVEIEMGQKDFNCDNCNIKGHSTDYCGKNEFIKYLFLDILTLRKHIFNFFKQHIKRDYLAHRILEDFVCVSGLGGNDFICNVPCLDIFFSGMHHLFYLITYSFNCSGLYITEKGNVNFYALKQFLKNLAKYEGKYYFDKLEDLRRSRKRYSFLVSNVLTVDESGLVDEKSIFDNEKSNIDNEKSTIKTEKSNLGNEKSNIETEKSTIKDEKVNFETEKVNLGNEKTFYESKITELKAQKVTETQITGFFEEIDLHTDLGRIKYYNEKLKVNSDKEIEDVCIKYLKMLSWTFKYYYGNIPCWSEYYSCSYAPMVCDLIKLQNLELNFKQFGPLSPLEQLLSVMPPLCKDSVPDCLHPIFDAYPEIYPLNVEFDAFDKLHSYQAVALLPKFEIKQIYTHLSKLLEEAPISINFTNIFDKPKIYFNSNFFNGEQFLNLYFKTKNYLKIEASVNGVLKKHFEYEFRKEDVFENKVYEYNVVYGVVEYIRGVKWY